MTEKRDVKKGYDEIASVYASKVAKNKTPQKQKALVNKFASWIEGTVLDVGCGPTPFQSSTTDTIGLDFSRGQLSEVNSNVPVLQGDMSSLPFQDEAFDGLVAFYSLIHLPLEEHQQAWAEFERVLKDGSFGLVTEGDSRWEGKQENWIDSGKEMSWSLAGKERTKRNIKEAGFELLETVDIVDPTADDGSTKPFYLIKK